MSPVVRYPEFPQGDRAIAVADIQSFSVSKREGGIGHTYDVVGLLLGEEWVLLDVEPEKMASDMEKAKSGQCPRCYGVEIHFDRCTAHQDPKGRRVTLP